MGRVMENASQSNADARIKRLIESLAQHQPPFSSLGTPFLADTAATEALVSMGSTAVPALLEALASDNPKPAMYAAYCLGLIGDRTALPALRRTDGYYMAKEPKEEYDYGAISAVRRAVECLDK